MDSMMVMMMIIICFYALCGARMSMHVCACTFFLCLATTASLMSLKESARSVQSW